MIKATVTETPVETDEVELDDRNESASDTSNDSNGTNDSDDTKPPMS